MADFNVRSDSVNVEHIMAQIRARIREKRGVDYTEVQLQELATAQLEKILNPNHVKSDLVEEFVRKRAELDTPASLQEAVDESALFETHRPWLRAVRRVLRPLLKLSINTKALAALSDLARGEVERRSRDRLTFSLVNNLVVEMTRLGIQVKNLTMRVESMQSRLEFNERRARALEGVVVYKPSEPETVAQQPPRPPVYESRPPAEFRPRQDVQPPPPHVQAAAPPSSGAPAAVGPDGQRTRRRRRRRGRRGGAGMPGGAPGQPGQQNQPGQPSPAGSPAPPQNEHEHVDDGPDDGPDSSDDGSGGSGNDPNPQ